MLPLSLDPACSWHLWILTDLPVACCLSGRLFLPDISLSTSFSDDATFSPSHLRLSSLNLDSPSYWQLWNPGPDTLFSPDKLLSLLTSPESWRSFSPHPLLLTRLSLGFQVFVDTSFCSKLCSFEAFYLDISFVLRWFFILRSFSSHLFLLTYSYFASKTHPVNYKTCTKSFLHQKTCTKYFPVTQYYFVLQSWHKVLPSTTSYYKACTKCFPVLLSKTRLAQTKDFRVLLRTTKLAQSTSQCYFLKQDVRRQRTSEYCFVLQSWHKVLPSATFKNKTCTDKGLPSTTSYYKACTKYFPVLLWKTRRAQTKDFRVLLCTAKLAQSTSQCYFQKQDLHKQRTSEYYPKTRLVRTKDFPVLLRTVKLAQTKSQRQNTGFRAISNLQASPGRSNSTATVICRHCLANHNVTASTLWCYILVVMYCCDDVLLWWCIVMVTYCCGDVLLWWCIVVVMYCCCDLMMSHVHSTYNGV